MVEQSIIRYVRQATQAGHSRETIRNQLVRAGYPASEVNAAFTALGIQRTIHLSAWHAIALVVVAIVVLGSILYVIRPRPYSFELQLQPIQTQVEAGTLAEWNVLLQSASASEADLDMTYELLLNDQSLAKKEERLTLQQRRVTKASLPLPIGLSPGPYEIQTTVLADGAERTQRFPIEVILREAPPTVKPDKEPPQPPTPIIFADECPGPCTDPDPCVKGTCEAGACVFTEIAPCCGNRRCEPGEDIRCLQDCPTRPGPEQLIAEAEALAASDPTSAVKLCATLPLPSLSDKCYAKVASNAGTSTICAQLTDSQRRDSCYLNFALKGDYAVCEKIENHYYKVSCDSLAGLKGP